MQITNVKLNARQTLEMKVLKLAVGETTGPLKLVRKSGETVPIKTLRAALHVIARDNETVYRTKEKGEGLVIQRAH